MIWLVQLFSHQMVGKYLFQTLLITYLGLLLIEEIWTGFVSVYLVLISKASSFSYFSPNTHRMSPSDPAGGTG